MRFSRGIAAIGILACVVAATTGWTANTTDANPAKLIRRGALPEPADGVKHQAIVSIDLPGAPRETSAVLKAIRQAVVDHPEWLGGVPLADLVVSYQASVPSTETEPGMAYVQFVQQHEGMDVEGSSVQFAVKLLPDRSVLMTSRATVYPTLTLSPSNRKSMKMLHAEGAKAVGLSMDKATIKGEVRKLRFLEGRWRRVNETHFAESGLKAVVDEDTGESWAEDERVEASIRGRVHGDGKIFDPASSGFDDLNLKDLQLVIPRDLSFTYTDANGRFSFPNRTQDDTVQANLLGKSARVHSINRPDAVRSGQGSLVVDLDLRFNRNGLTACDNEAITAQVNAYYHTTYIHDWARARLGSSLSSIDCGLRVETNATGNISWYNNGNPNNVISCTDQMLIHFGEAGHCSGQPIDFLNNAYDTIIYHEYGHFLDDAAGGIASGTAGLSLSEGWGDTIASYVSGQPLIGENFGYDLYPADTECHTECIRRTDNHYQYNPNDPDIERDDPHIIGEAWSGLMWHLRQDPTVGVGTAEQLLVRTLLANSTDIPDAVHDLVVADDDDGNLNNGTPHLTAICAAASAHGLKKFIPVACPCYVLTAAYGRQDAPEIQTLWTLHHRFVRDWNAPWHQRYLAWYDEVGPRVAAFIHDKPALRGMVRAIVTPTANLAQWWLARHPAHAAARQAGR